MGFFISYQSAFIDRNKRLGINQHQTDNKPIETTGDKSMLKKYQVAETKSDTWIVVKVCTEMLPEEDNKIIGNLDSIDHTEYNTAAEAQEYADEINEGDVNELTSDD